MAVARWGGKWLNSGHYFVAINDRISDATEVELRLKGWTPRFLARAVGRMALPLLEVGEVYGGAIAEDSCKNETIP